MSSSTNNFNRIEKNYDELPDIIVELTVSPVYSHFPRRIEVKIKYKNIGATIPKSWGVSIDTWIFFDDVPDNGWFRIEITEDDWESGTYWYGSNSITFTLTDFKNHSIKAVTDYDEDGGYGSLWEGEEGEQNNECTVFYKPKIKPRTTYPDFNNILSKLLNFLKR